MDQVQIKTHKLRFLYTYGQNFIKILEMLKKQFHKDTVSIIS